MDHHQTVQLEVVYMHFQSAAESNVRRPRSTRANMIESQRREKKRRKRRIIIKLCALTSVEV